MGKSFDIGVESLSAGAISGANSSAGGSLDSSIYSSTGSSVHSLPEIAAPTSANANKSFFLETFGCQMNAHDSEKVAGVLLSRGYRSVDDPAAADLVLYNTCSIREKAAQ